MMDPHDYLEVAWSLLEGSREARANAFNLTYIMALV